jgi:hypothetical protein
MREDDDIPQRKNGEYRGFSGQLSFTVAWREG